VGGRTSAEGAIEEVRDVLGKKGRELVRRREFDSTAHERPAEGGRENQRSRESAGQTTNRSGASFPFADKRVAREAASTTTTRRAEMQDLSPTRSERTKAEEVFVSIQPAKVKEDES
jgi:hypothetical protein